MKTEYYNEICRQMKNLAEMRNVIFIGQQVVSEDFYGTLGGVPLSKRIEMPVAEDMQIGTSIGLALDGFLPVSIIQRMDFLPRAADQIVNHLNLLYYTSRGMYNPKVIIRTTIGTKKPLDVGYQHSQDLTEMFSAIPGLTVRKVTTAEEVERAYVKAMESPFSSMIVESQELYYA